MGKDQEFLEAARNGNISFIEKVLNQKAKRAGPLASLRRGTGVNVQDSGGYSALHHACLNGHTDIVKLLLANEASPNLPDSRGSSPLHLAAWAGEEEIVRLLLTHPYRPANPNLQTIEKETPLHCAAQHGHTEALAILLAHNADPNMRNTRGETPLDLAAQYGRLQAVQMLIRAHPELIAPYSRTAIEGVGNRSRHSSPTPHSGSVSTPSPSSPSMLSTSTCATPTRCVFPHTCLHLASRNGHKNVVEVLLAAGVSVNLLTPSGTALHEAALCGKESVVRTLLKADIDLNATDAEERTALDILKEFPPHVTKHIIAVINNFRNQMDTDDGEEVVYRQQPTQQQHHQQRASNNSHYQKQQHNSHYHFNSNNHLLNHSLSMQQSSYSKQRFSAGNAFNGAGKSLDSGLQTDDSSSAGGGRIANEGIHSQNEMGISPSSSMSSFEPQSVSPHSRCSGGFGANPPLLTSFTCAAPPKKPPRRNLSVSPTHTGQPFSYTSPNHQQQLNFSGRRQYRSPTSNDSASYSHRSHGSMGGSSFDETQLHDRHRGDRLFSSAREATSRPAAGLSLSSSTDMFDKRHHEQDQDYNENLVPNSAQEGTNSMKRPKPATRSICSISKDIINCENPTLKSYNPNRKLKRNRNSYSVSIGEKENYSLSSDSNSEPKTQIPQSPTHYKQPPTPDHPPPSSSHAERTIHERIRPLSQEYKRRSALLQQQQQQQLMIDSGTSPPRHVLVECNNDYALVASPTKLSTAVALPTMHQATRSSIRGSSGSLSSSVSLSDQSVSTDCVEEFMSDIPFGGLLKGSTMNVRKEPTYATVNKAAKRTPSKPASPPPQPPPTQGHQQAQAPQQPIYATIHKTRYSTTTTTSSSLGEDQQQRQRGRPPIPMKPVIPDRKLFKAQPPQLPDEVVTQPPPQNTKSNGHDPDQRTTNGCVENTEEAPHPDAGTTRTPNNELYGSEEAQAPTYNVLSNQSSLNSSSNDERHEEEQGQQQDQRQSNQQRNESSNEDTSTTATTSHESSILSPFNAEEARKKISEIIESFGSGILNTNLTPTNDIELDFDDLEMSAERQELISRLRSSGLLHLERILFENGYDNFKFVNGVLEQSDLEVMDVPTADTAKLLDLVKTLPKAEFQPQIPLDSQQETQQKGESSREGKGVATLHQWLDSICLPEYNDYFNKHLYNTIDSVCGVWDVELQTVLEINKVGHRRRILQSVAFMKQTRELKSAKTPVGENQETKLMATNGCKEPQRNPTTGYRKNRPAPQPPTPKAAPQELQIRAPSELSLGLPANLRTKWRHSANALLNEQIKYEVYYLGSTVVKELRGTESTRKSIKKYRQDHRKATTTNAFQSSAADSSHSLNKQRRTLLTLAISHRGVEFIDINTKRTICEHEIQNINCACQDSDDLRHFAYITKENDTHYCHVFNVDSTDLATEIILTLGQAFEVAYQLALRDGITATPLALNNDILQGMEQSPNTVNTKPAAQDTTHAFELMNTSVIDFWDLLRKICLIPHN